MSLKLSYLQKTLWLYFIAALMILMGGVASASMPPAGYVIGNQASAQYQIDNETFKVTSNLVQTTIAQKGALTLTNSQQGTATPGLTVYFSHQITNTGNGNDLYNLTSAVVSGGLTNLEILPDSNADGIPDQTTNPITATPTLAAGETYNVLVRAMVPSSAAISSTASLSLTATSSFDNTQTVTNTDTITVTNNAVLNVNKSFSINEGVPGTQFTVSFTYRNVGNQAAGLTQIQDTLPAGLTYVAASGKWSLNPNGATAALNDNNTGNPITPNGGIGYLYTGASNLITITLPQIPMNQVATVSFDVRVLAGQPAGVLNNFGQVDYNATGGNTLPGSPQPTNYARFTVLAAPGVIATDSGSSTDEDGSVNGVVTLGQTTPVYSGSAILFDNVIQNTGNSIDSFDIIVSEIGSASNTFPVGTSMTLTKSDGITPLTDSNGDGVVDTGPLNPGESYHVFLRVQLPPGASGGPYEVTKTAQSITKNTVTASVIDRVNSITAASVDLTNTATGTVGGGRGWGPGPETTPQTTRTTNPNNTVSFNLYINHTAGVLGSYVLQYSSTSTFTAATTNVMPAGWDVVFYDANTNDVVTSATLPATNGTTASQYHYIAEVTVPSTALAGDQPVYFRVYSPALGISDIKYDQVTVDTVHDVGIQPNNIGQAYAGGSMIYSHVLQNHGNVAETSGAITLSNTAASSGWTATAYLDTNNNGVFEPGTDPVLTDISQITGGLQPFQSVNVFVKVQAPAGALPGANNVTSIEVTVANDSNSSNDIATDQTSLISGYITLAKKQFPDPSCTTTPTSSLAYQTAMITTIKPGECVIYQVTATNNGVTPVTQLKITDQTPDYTTFNQVATTGGTAASPTINNAGTVGGYGVLDVTWPTVNPGQTAVVYYSIKLNSQ